jgi:uncharacterized protein Yka (UPF0111/DUF47 family)
MQQANDIQRRFHLVQHAIGQAAQACSAERSLPGELRDCIQRLDKQADRAPQVLLSQDGQRIRKLAVEMEQLGGRAERVCANVTQLTPQLKSAVRHMHSQLLEFKQEVK